MNEPSPCNNGCWWNPEGPGYKFYDDCPVHGVNRPGQCVTAPTVAHPAQKLAIAAFAAEQAAIPPTTPPTRTIWDKLVQHWASVPGHTLPISSSLRKEIPVDAGFYRYFPAAIVCGAALSAASNAKHNPGEPLHHARGKSMDHADCIARHTLDKADAEPARRNDPVAELEEATCRFWRAAADLQELCERLGAPLAPAARLPEVPPANDVQLPGTRRTVSGL